MSNAILLSSSPALTSRRDLAAGRSSSPDFPSLEELVSQRVNLANARPPSQSISTAGGFTRGGSGLGYDLGKEPSPVGGARFEVEDSPIDAPDTSLVEISPIDSGTPPPRAGPKPKKAPASKKPGRARGDGEKASAKETSTNSTSREDSPNELATAPKETKPRRKQTGSVSRHFKPPQEPARSKTPENVNDPLNLETAVMRRVNWTPPPKDTLIEFGSRSSDIIELPSSSRPQNVERDREFFQSLTETYGYELGDDSLLAAESRDVQAAFKKRKLIEMVPTSNTSNTANSAHSMGPPPLPEVSPTKTKAPKKKARTITGLATAAYAPQEPELPPTKPADAPAAAPVGTNGKAAKSKATKRKPRAPKKKDDPRMVLLPPEAALEQVAQQDFVFGTSSQLVREQDRDVCELPRLRNTMAVIEEEEYVTPINSDAIQPAEALPRLWNAAARDADGDLLHPEVIDLAQDSPSGSGILSDDSDPFGYVNITRMSQRLTSSVPNVRTGANVTKSSTESNAVMEPPLMAASQASSERQAVSSAPATTHIPLLSSMTSTSPPPSSQKRLAIIYDVQSTLSNSAPLSNAQSESPTKAPNYIAPEKPKFDLYTDAQLARQVAAYGFKPVKRRAGMISLLDECWSSKYERQSGVRAYSTASAAAATTEVSAPAAATAEMPPPTQPAAKPAKKPRGRPRKNSASTPASETASASPLPASVAPANAISAKKPRGRPRKQASPAPASPPRKTRTARPAAKPAAKPAPSTPPRKRAPVLEIPDSDSEADPSSPESIFSSPTTHDVSTGDDSALSLALPPTTEESSLYAQITKAVTSAPPSTDPANPSFHEKILMYESIIVEDLAAWLNTGALDGVGYDGEVSAQDVKKWCEAKSVCCVWRYRMGGAERRML
ncbi:uncharacterized protein DNG_05221 [Cephalotrichum gorgonifer]|uniref:Structure-specific endonuclease subunit SLX4 n=1 Tax=Cephalotrichum gorgonifer TaxID=2041049 RepID=A0AAE8SVC4_9PEZI|nr:uncharacterized protein DNG_05221 [Cephalotrichum gorgonifer]